MNYYKLIDSGKKIIKLSDKNYLKKEKEVFKSKYANIYGMKEIYNEHQLYVLALFSIVLILMFPFGYDYKITIYSF
ncbi:hypothetical protein IOLA_177 [uncultured bacterium]|nr:hypothetical protein IOLA_177 [uncultured bacterium]